MQNFSGILSWKTSGEGREKVQQPTGRFLPLTATTLDIPHVKGLDNAAAENKCEYSVTLVVWHKVLLTYIWGVPRLVGRYCSYLLPKQDGGKSQI